MKFFILFLLCSLVYLSLADEKANGGQAQVKSLDDANEEARENQQIRRVERNPLFSFSGSHQRFGPMGMGFAPFPYYGWGYGKK